MHTSIQWPGNKKFAFTIFDDADNHTDRGVQNVYSLLNELGLRTTKSVWPNKGIAEPIEGGFTCEDPGYVEWLNELANNGFEIGYHLATYHSSVRAESERALDKYKELFNSNPTTMANHALCKDTIYWGPARLVNPAHILLYRALNIHKDKGFLGHVESSEYFWGDLCRERIKFVRNFTYRDINTYKICPEMPYHDPKKPYVNYWYASTEGPTLHPFLKVVQKDNIDKLSDEGGLCIMYTHFGNGFTKNEKVDPDFIKSMEYIAKQDCWFAPVGEVLNYLLAQKGHYVISEKERTRLERQWLKERFVLGST